MNTAMIVCHNGLNSGPERRLAGGRDRGLVAVSDRA